MSREQRTESNEQGVGSEEGMRLKQIGMRACMMKSNSTRRIVSFIDEYPITLNMTAECILPFAVERVIFMLWRQWLFVDDHIQNFGKFMYFHTAFLHKFTLSFERAGKSRSEHGLIVRVQIHQHLFK